MSARLLAPWEGVKIVPFRLVLSAVAGVALGFLAACEPAPYRLDAPTLVPPYGVGNSASGPASGTPPYIPAAPADLPGAPQGVPAR